MVQAGLRSKLSAIMEINKCSEEDAKEELKRISEDNQITGQDIDWTGDKELQEDTVIEETANESFGESESGRSS